MYTEWVARGSAVQYNRSSISKQQKFNSLALRCTTTSTGTHCVHVHSCDYSMSTFL